MFTIPCEAIFNGHEHIYRSALVGVGEPGRQRPVIIVETWPENRPAGEENERKLLEELARLALSNTLTKAIRDIHIHPGLPVDIRHNAKIFREKLVDWAAQRLN